MAEKKDLDAQKSYFMKICSAREYCDNDIRRKAQLREMSFQETEEILDFLHRENFLNEGRYACAYARDKAQISGWGEKKIAYQLRMRHLSETDIKKALAQLDTVSVQKRQNQVLQLKWDFLKKEPDLFRRKEKLLRYALSRGYSYENVREFFLHLKHKNEEI